MTLVDTKSPCCHSEVQHMQYAQHIALDNKPLLLVCAFTGCFRVYYLFFLKLALKKLSDPSEGRISEEGIMIIVGNSFVQVMSP